MTQQSEAIGASRQRLWGLILLFTGLIAFAALIALRLVGGDNNPLRQNAKLRLEDYLSSGEALPLGQYVSVDARWVLGPFAIETSMESSGDGTDDEDASYYYYLRLKDGSVMALKSEDKDELQVLDRMSEWLMQTPLYPLNGETLHLQGKLKEFPNARLTQLFDEVFEDAFGVKPQDKARYVLMDTNAGYEPMLVWMLFSGGAIGAGIGLLIQWRRKRKAALA